ncbi:MAG TPA: prepilin-type N-terminal cleavage/methylation domain-containing protein [Steroidobacteraceae bacterium]|nr:prepilin-type N-terminal cleavage/methylation domain-containing protein [Steroidobacteraceae bacterium]
MPSRYQRGFTLIELVVVIVILGILAAFAVPKYMGLEVQARIAAVNAMTGTIKSTANMAYGVALATNQTGAAGTITVNGVNYAVAFGYPTSASIVTLIQDTSGFNVVAGNPVALQKVGAANPATCEVTYTQVAAANGVPAISNPPPTGGC